MNRSLSHLRKNRRLKIFSSLEDIFHKKPGGPVPASGEPLTATSRLEENERKELLNRSIQTLPQNQRIAFILSKYEDLSYKEISEVMNLSISSVESLLHRAKLNLQKKLARQFSEYVKS